MSNHSNNNSSSSSSTLALRANRPEMEPRRAYNEAWTDLTQWLLALLGAKFNKKQASYYLIGSISFTIHIIFLWITRNPRPKYVDPMINLVVPILNCVVCGLIVDSVLDSPVFKWIVISSYILVTIVTVPDHKYVVGGFMEGLGAVCRAGCSMFGKLYDGFGEFWNHGNGSLGQQADSGGSRHNGHG